MKILLTGGGSGGHFYPLVAVAEEVNKIVKEEKILPVELFFMSDSPYDVEALLENNIKFVSIPAGKIRRYFSLLNIIDVVKTFFGTIIAIVKVYEIFPDVVFSKGAYASFPVLIAARILRIPIFIHESDSVPGKTNSWSAKFAKRIAVSYPETIKYFDKDKTAYTGNPIRKEIASMQTKDVARKFLNLDENIPVVLILGGSLGAKLINEQIISILPQLVEKYYVIHQVGKSNIQELVKTSEVVLFENTNKKRYRPFDYLNDLNLSMASGAADLVISRAGSTIFEIASWGTPSIIIPITDTNGDHQRQNAYNYSRSGGAIVVEESNLTPNILIAEIDRILSNKSLSEKMSQNAKSFIKIDAARVIAKELLNISLQHEK